MEIVENRIKYKIRTILRIETCDTGDEGYGGGGVPGGVKTPSQSLSKK